MPEICLKGGFNLAGKVTLPPVYRDKKQSTKRKQTQIRSVSDLRAAVLKREKKKSELFFMKRADFPETSCPGSLANAV